MIVLKYVLVRDFPTIVVLDLPGKKDSVHMGLNRTLVGLRGSSQLGLFLRDFLTQQRICFNSPSRKLCTESIAFLGALLFKSRHVGT